MAVEVKVAPDERLEYISVFLEDRRTLSQYFNLTEYPDTLTGGKNAFLIAGTDYLEPNTEVQIQIRDAKGNVVYTESSDGSPTEYYEGISKVVAAYVYPNDSVLQAKDATAYGPCTIVILGELKYYDNNGSKTEVPEIWKGKYNVRWVGTANINPALANTTRVRFFYRPQATITEILKPIYNVSGTSITASAITASYANIRLNRLETFAGDVKRVKVYRTSQGTVSDFELIQDILIESKELLQTFDATGSVITDTGVFDSQIFQKFWNSGSLNATLNSTQFSGSFAAKLSGSGNFKYTASLDLSDKTTYELSLDGFYTSSTQSSLKVHISGSQNGDLVVDTLTGLTPTKNFTNYITQFTIPKQEPTASLYFSQTQGDWYLKDISLRAAQDTAFSPNEVSFIVSMPTNISNETFNFKFEFFDVNNNFIPVAVTGSQTFVGGNDNLTTIATTVSGLSSSFDGSLTALSQSVSGTISFTSQSVSGTIAQVSSSLNAGITTSYSSSIYTLQTLADGNYSGSFISGSVIYAPVIGGQNGYISGKFTVGAPPNSIVLDATTSTRRIYIGTGTYNNSNTSIYLDSDGKFSLKDKLTFDGSNLSINGGGTFTGALSGGTISIGSGNSIFKADSNGIYLGNATFGSAPFRVTPNGELTATSATISGTINASGGNFSGFVTAGNMKIGTSVNGSNNGIYINAQNYWYDTGEFVIGNYSGTSWNASTTARIAVQSSGTTYANPTKRKGLILVGGYDVVDGPDSGYALGTYIGEGGINLMGEYGYSINIAPLNTIRIYHQQRGTGSDQVKFEARNLSGLMEDLATFHAFPGTSYAAVNIINGGLRTRNVAESGGGYGSYSGNGNGGYAHYNEGTMYSTGLITANAGLTSNGLLTVNASANITGTLGVTGDITSQASDKRLKENIIPITSALDKVDKINGVYFNFTDKANELNKSLNKNRQVGFLAQEIQSVLPEIVKPAPFDIDSDGNSISGENYLTIHYEKVVPLLLQAIKELKFELDEVKKLIK
jgi:hypothetical protein